MITRKVTFQIILTTLVLWVMHTPMYASDAIEKQLTRPDLTLFTTWYADPTTSMVIQWLLYTPEHEPEIIRLRWQADDAQHWQSLQAQQAPFPKSKLTRYRVELTNLEPDTLYRMRFGYEGPIYTFHTAPKKLTDKLVFVAGGDAGNWPAAVQVSQQAAKCDPLFAVLGGDLAYANGVNVDAWIVFLNNWRKHMLRSDKSLIPLIVAIGNHEVEGSFNKSREMAPFFFNLFGPYFPDTTYNAMTFGNYLQLIMLDTQHISPIAGEQTNWLKETLQKTPPTYRYAIYHVPGYPSHREFEGELSQAVRENWSPLFEQYKVPVVFENHDHCYKRTHPLINKKPVTSGFGVVYIGDGAWGGEIRDVRQTLQNTLYAKAQKVNHFIQVTLTPQSQHFRAISNTGDVVDQMTLTHSNAK